jgi:hypothetical protein
MARAEQPDLRLFTLHCLRESTWAMRLYRHHGYAVYEPGDEGRITDLYIWIDSCRRHDAGWPLKKDKALLYKMKKLGVEDRPPEKAAVMTANN